MSEVDENLESLRDKLEDAKVELILARRASGDGEAFREAREKLYQTIALVDRYLEERNTKWK